MNLFAYLDPGSGSILIQAVIAAVLGFGVYFRQFFIAPFQAAWRWVMPKRVPLETDTKMNPNEPN